MVSTCQSQGRKWGGDSKVSSGGWASVGLWSVQGVGSRSPWEVRSREPSISVVAAAGTRDGAGAQGRRSRSLELKAGGTMGKGVTQETHGHPEWLDADGAEWGGGGVVGKENAVWLGQWRGRGMPVPPSNLKCVGSGRMGSWPQNTWRRRTPTEAGDWGEGVF